jgi:hypothetical protein
MSKLGALHHRHHKVRVYRWTDSKLIAEDHWHNSFESALEFAHSVRNAHKIKIYNSILEIVKEFGPISEECYA